MKSGVANPCSLLSKEGERRNVENVMGVFCALVRFRVEERVSRFYSPSLHSIER